MAAIRAKGIGGGLLAGVVCLGVALAGTSSAQKSYSKPGATGNAQQGKPVCPNCQPCYPPCVRPYGAAPYVGATPYVWSPYYDYGVPSPYGASPGGAPAPYTAPPAPGAPTPAAPSAAPSPAAFGAAGGAGVAGPGAGAAPGLIGDSFGGQATHVLVTRPKAGYAVIGGVPAYYPAVLDPATQKAGIVSNSNLNILGDTTVAVQGPFQWESVDAFPGASDADDLPDEFALEEQDDVTAGMEDAYPESQSVKFNESRADGKRSSQVPDVPDYNVFMDYTIVDTDFFIPQGTPGASIGRSKIGEDTSPIPQDRLLLDYSYFSNARVFGGGIDVQRFTPGIEKTFFGGLASVEVKAPMAITLDNNILAGGATDVSSAEYGNMSFTFKGLVWRMPYLSLGVRVTAPTADDVLARSTDGRTLMKIENESVLIAPFFGWYFEPCDRLFFHGFLQWDVDASGSPVYTEDALTENLAKQGVLTDTTLMYTDVGLGYWAYRACSPCANVTAIALTGEIHCTQSLQDPDVVFFDDFIAEGNSGAVGDPHDEIAIRNMTLGVHVMCRGSRRLTVAYGFPLDDEGDRVFDGELRVVFNQYFGSSACGGW